MKYTLKKTNYRNVKIFKDNVLDARTYFIPYSSFDNLKNTDVLNERYSSDEVTVSFEVCSETAVLSVATISEDVFDSWFEQEKNDEAISINMSAMQIGFFMAFLS